MFNESLKLSNGVTVPQLALGTWLIDDGIVADAVRSAIKIGYRHIDTAQAYGNERGVGEGVRTCGIQREQIFVTSKVAAEHKDYKSAADGIDETLRKTGLGCSMRIPLNEEHDIVKAKLKVPPTYMIPVFIGIGYPDPNEKELEQSYPDIDKQLHYGGWK